jgi:hypothetical protein
MPAGLELGTVPLYSGNSFCAKLDNCMLRRNEARSIFFIRKEFVFQSFMHPYGMRPVAKAKALNASKKTPLHFFEGAFYTRKYTYPDQITSMASP